MPRPVKLACVQFNPLPPIVGDNKSTSLENLRRAHEFVKDASKQQANIVIFPEFFISG